MQQIVPITCDDPFLYKLAQSLGCIDASEKESHIHNTASLMSYSVHVGDKVRDCAQASFVYGASAVQERLAERRGEDVVGDAAQTYFRVQTSALECVWTLRGNNTSLGAISSPYAAIRSFGPHAFPLSTARGFGIREIAQHANRFGSCFALPSVWFDIKVRSENERIILELCFTGLTLDHPTAFSFYVKSNSAQIESMQLPPQSLHRYSGDAQPVCFSDSLLIESEAGGKMEVIPLAGEGCFWDCEYLLAFMLHPLQARVAYTIRLRDSY